MENETIVETRELTKVYGDGAEVRALDGVSLRIGQGEFVAVMGPSGSGKSTLLHLIGALDRPSSGQVIVAGQDLAKVKNLDRFRSQTVGFVFQLHNLIPTLTALENVEIPLYEQRISGRDRRARAKELLELVGLGDRLSHYPNQLSGGEQQRCAIARAFATQPKLLFADEPTGNLEQQTGKRIIDLLFDLNHELGTTLIMATHDEQLAELCDRRLHLDGGRLVKPDESISDVGC